MPCHIDKHRQKQILTYNIHMHRNKSEQCDCLLVEFVLYIIIAYYCTISKQDW